MTTIDQLKLGHVPGTESTPDEVLNVFGELLAVCHDDRKYWTVYPLHVKGLEINADWYANKARLEGYEKITPEGLPCTTKLVRGRGYRMSS